MNGFPAKLAATLFPYLPREKAQNIVVQFNFACSPLAGIATAHSWKRELIEAIALLQHHVVDHRGTHLMWGHEL